ncbi:hypothetical protein MASSI9I_50599 [Massilia sp. 9I]|nr:hypothetical protein MASSI9I_50599 [Massilia sp. 9I]
MYNLCVSKIMYSRKHEKYSVTE